MANRFGFSRVTDVATNVGAAILGVLLLHEFAYQLAEWLQAGHHVAAPDHQHQSVLLAVAGPLALVSGATVVLRQVHRLGLAVSASAPQMTVGVAGLYLLQESTEAMISGGGLAALVTNRAVILGVLLAPVMAWLLVKVMAQAVELVRVWLNIESAPKVPAGLRLRPVDVTWVDAHLCTRAQPRAPPFVCM